MDGDEFGPPPWLEYTRYAAEDETESRFITGDDDTSSMGSSASSATSYSTVWTVDSAGVRSKRTKKKKKKKRGKRTVACSVCGRKESSSIPVAQSHFTAAQRKKKRGARCKSCLGAHASRRTTAEYNEFGLSLLRGAEREAAKIDELITRSSITWSTTGQIMLIDGLSGAHASLYGARIGGVPGSSVPPLVSAWRMETGECVFERAHFLHGGRAAEAGLAIRARIEDTSRPLRAIIVTDLGTSESLDAFEEVILVSSFVYD